MNTSEKVKRGFKMKSRPELGSKIEAKVFVEKKKTGSYRDRTETRWERESKSIEGIYTGYRFVANGITDWYDDGPDYKPTEHFEVWLVVTNPRHNPIHVLPEDATIVPQITVWA